MSLQTKFNLALAIIFLLALAITGFISYKVEIKMADATSAYTTDHIAPILNSESDKRFFPETVPPFAVHQTFARFSQRFPNYTYREAVLNPTNPNDRATNWEVELTRMFQQNPDLEEFQVEHTINNELSFFLAQPIKITDPDCLQCHGDPNDAPPGYDRNIRDIQRIWLETG